MGFNSAFKGLNRIK